MQQATKFPGSGRRTRHLGIATLIAALALIAAPVPAAVAGFGGGRTVPTSDQPAYVTAIADFDGDGRPDVAAGGNPGRIAIYRNFGNRRFAASAFFTPGGRQTLMDTGDLNGDGHPDLVTADYLAETLTVLLNNGTGGFASPTVYVAAQPEVLSLADVDDDGDVDVITGGKSLNVFRNSGHGTLAAPEVTSLGNYRILSTSVADFDGDGDPDIAASHSAGGVIIAFNAGDGTFPTNRRYEIADSFTYMAAGDLNGDGRPDLAVAANDQTLSLFFNDGNGDFTPGVVRSTSGEPRRVALADLDSDGDQDVILQADGGPRLATYLNDGTGVLYRNFADTRFGDTPSLAFGHLDGDNYLDVAGADLVLFGIHTEYGDASVVDGDVPTVTMTVDPADHPNAGNGSFNIAQSGTDGVLVHVRATENGEIQGVSCTDDDGSGSPRTVLDVAGGSGSVTLHDGAHFVTCTATNGTTVSDPAALGMSVDQTPPTVDGSVTPDPVIVGSGASATATTSDANGIATESCQQPDTSSVGEKTLTCQATDRFGNSASRTVHYSVIPVPDSTAPVVTLAVDSADTQAASGWYNRATSGTDGVLVHATASDDRTVTNLHCTDGSATVLDTSGTTGSFTLNDGVHSVWCIASDGANTSSPKTLAAKVDQTVPTITGSVAPNPVIQGQDAVATPHASDSGSGIDTSSCATPDTGTIGDFAVTCAASDLAGNSASTTASYTVAPSPKTPLSIAVNATVTYGGGTPVLTVIPTGLKPGDTLASLEGTLTCVLPDVSTAPAGTSAQIGTCSGLSSEDYAINYAPGHLVVTKRTLTVWPTNATRDYGTPNNLTEYSLSGFANSEGASAVSGKPALSTTATTTSSVGTYPITAALGTLSATNYAFSFNTATLTITQAPLTTTVGGTQVYGSSTPAFTASGTVPSGVARTGTPTCTKLAGGTAITNALGAGTYTVDPSTCTGVSLTGSLAGNYHQVLAGGPFVVTKAPVTVTTTSTSTLVSLLTFRVTYTSKVVNAATGLPVSGVTVTTQLDNGGAPTRCSATTNTAGAATCTAGSVVIAANTPFTATAAEGPNTQSGTGTSKVKVL